MLELFAGQLTREEILHSMTFKEAIKIRDIRIKRKLKERKELEEDRAKELEEHERIQARNQILS